MSHKLSQVSGCIQGLERKRACANRNGGHDGDADLDACHDASRDGLRRNLHGSGDLVRDNGPHGCGSSDHLRGGDDENRGLSRHTQLIQRPHR